MHGKKLIALASALVLVWIWRSVSSVPYVVTDNPNVVMLLEYLCMLGSGFAIWYGYYVYSKTSSILKPKDDLEEKRRFFVDAKRFQNRLVYIACAVDLCAFALTFKDQCAFVCVIALIFCVMGFPSENRFENDFLEPEYDDEEFGSGSEDGSGSGLAGGPDGAAGSGC